MFSSSFSIPRTVGFGAGLLALVLVIFSAAGALWGLWRPALTGQRVQDGGYALDSVANVQFSSFITFAAITGVLAAVVALGVHAAAPRRRGFATLLWVGLVALLGAGAFYIVGGAIAPSMPSNPGQTVEFVPDFSPGIGWAVAPFMAVLAYWSAEVVDVRALADAPSAPTDDPSHENNGVADEEK